MKDEEAVLYSMPSLDEDKVPIGQEKVSDYNAVMEKANELQKNAYDEGFASGEKAGFAVGEQKTLVLLEGIEKIMSELMSVRAGALQGVDEQVVELAVTIARKVIVEEVSIKPEIMISIVREALKRMERIGTIAIKVNPAIYDIFINNRTKLTDIHDDIVIDADASVPVTGPLVISKTEEVVTDIESLIENITKEIKITADKTADKKMTETAIADDRADVMDDVAIDTGEVAELKADIDDAVEKPVDKDPE